MSNNSGLLFINKTIQNEDYSPFVRYNIREDMFTNKIDRDTFKFIQDYYERHRQMPSYAMVGDSVKDFTYIPDITDSYSVLAEGISNRKIAVEFNKLFENEFQEMQESTHGNTSDLISVLTERLNHIKLEYTNKRSVGTDLKRGVDDYLKEYGRRSDGKSVKVWKSFMPYVNEEIGGFTSGNMYVYFGKSGRGKSFLMLRELLEMAMQGANILLWSLEMPTYDIMTRLYTILSSKLQLTKITTENGEMFAGFDSRKLRSGTMESEIKASFDDMLKHINEHISGNITIRGVNDPDFYKRDIKQLEADIETTGAEVVAIDPMYYMHFESNTSRTAGGDAAETSKKLRTMAGLKDIVILTVTQAEETQEKDTKERELKLPQRVEVKKTKALMEDASALFSIDTDANQGRGLCGIVKGRDGGEGTYCEITFLANYGLIEQIQVDEDLFEF